MSRWYLDANDKDVYLRDDKGIRWDYNQKEIVKILLDQDQRIAELEEQLKNAIVLPKYDKGQKFYYIRGNKVEEAYFQGFNNWITADVILNPHEVKDDDGYIDVDYDFDMVSPKQMFATKEEALAKLEELGESDVKD